MAFLANSSVQKSSAKMFPIVEFIIVTFEDC